MAEAEYFRTVAAVGAFAGYCQSAQFDITAALKDGDNQFAILCERTGPNEVRTGGLMGTVVLYREKCE
jgi:hypothetical protein